MSTSEAGDVWGLSAESARRAAHLGEVGYKRKGSRGRLWLWRPDVEALMVVKSRADRADAAGGVAGTEGLAKTG